MLSFIKDIEEKPFCNHECIHTERFITNSQGWNLQPVMQFCSRRLFDWLVWSQHQPVQSALHCVMTIQRKYVCSSVITVVLNWRWRSSHVRIQSFCLSLSLVFFFLCKIKIFFISSELCLISYAQKEKIRSVKLWFVLIKKILSNMNFFLSTGKALQLLSQFKYKIPILDKVEPIFPIQYLIDFNIKCRTFF